MAHSASDILEDHLGIVVRKTVERRKGVGLVCRAGLEEGVAEDVRQHIVVQQLGLVEGGQRYKARDITRELCSLARSVSTGVNPLAHVLNGLHIVTATGITSSGSFASAA
jgi:hypothetical protein